MTPAFTKHVEGVLMHVSAGGARISDRWICRFSWLRHSSGPTGFSLWIWERSERALAKRRSGYNKRNEQCEARPVGRMPQALPLFKWRVSQGVAEGIDLEEAILKGSNA